MNAVASTRGGPALPAMEYPAAVRAIAKAQQIDTMVGSDRVFVIRATRTARATCFRIVALRIPVVVTGSPKLGMRSIRVIPVSSPRNEIGPRQKRLAQAPLDPTL